MNIVESKYHLKEQVSFFISVVCVAVEHFHGLFIRTDIQTCCYFVLKIIIDDMEGEGMILRKRSHKVAEI